MNWPPTLPATSPAQGEVEGGACGARARPRGPRPKIALFWVAERNFDARDLEIPVCDFRLDARSLAFPPGGFTYVGRASRICIRNKRRNAIRGMCAKRFSCINRSQNAKPAEDPAGGPAPHIKGRRPQPSPGRSDGSRTGGGPNSYPKTPSAAPKTTPKVVSAPVLPHPTNTPGDLLWRTTIEIRA